MTSSVAELPLASPAEGKRRLPLVEHYLRQQQDLSAVERFAQHHESATRPAQETHYRALLPATPPAPGQQYAFQVDLDACTGCKACVTACHNLNGLDPGETWRSVGLLHGGTPEEPLRQTVTSACHHCVEPACLSGCPVNAYAKDPSTGVVRHLDDQCIGCQYCTFTCPYGVPQYNPRRGIVRKCDMCQGRLAAGEAPACVQACPNEAIRITLVDRAQALEDAQGDGFLPGAPSPGITVPTTVYATTRALPRNLLPASFYRVTPSEHHTPLVIMLVLTQLSVGAFAVDAAARALAPAAAPDSWRPLHALLAVVLGLAALGASVLHLGRPLYAFRAVLGLRTSWMSREILAFGLFAPLALLYAGSFWHEAAAGAVGLPRLAPEVATRAQQGLALAVTLAGAAGVTCSILIYHVTRRPFWSGARVAFRFTLTAVLLGLATAQATATVGSALGGAPPPGLSSATLATLTAVVAAVKLTGEALFLRHLGDRALTPLRRTAYLHTHDLARLTAARFAAGALGGLALPAFLAAAAPGASAPRLALALASLALLVAGELLERTLFFAAVTAPGMPGGLK